MLGPENSRTAERREGDAWVPIAFELLRPGDHFRLWEPSAKGAGALFEGVVLSDPLPCPPAGNWAFKADRVRELRASE